MTGPPDEERSAVTLRALSGRPLADAALRDLVVATARAIAERTGVELLVVETAPDRVRVALACPRIAAVGFAAELRRTTEAWYRGKHGASLWGEPWTEEPDPADWWKR